MQRNGVQPFLRFQCLSGTYDFQNGFFFLTDSGENQNTKSDICEAEYVTE